jgi:phage N-6-adenine-methyltransferase
MAPKQLVLIKRPVGRPPIHANKAAKQRQYRVGRAKELADLRAKAQARIWHSALNDRWGTPAEIFEPVRREFGITLDVCAEPWSATCARYFSPEMNGVAQDWGTDICWMNPPFSQVKIWLPKAVASAQAGATVICLVKHTPGVGWWRQHIPPEAEVRALGRVRFLHPDTHVQAKYVAGFDSALVILRPPTRH